MDRRFIVTAGNVDLEAFLPQYENPTHPNLVTVTTDP
jgi:hypothetical protein